ncbi:MAG: hypothetical protein AB3N11_00940 [Arenibacterium sp.]
MQQLFFVTDGVTPIVFLKDCLWFGLVYVVGGLAEFCMTVGNRLADSSSLAPVPVFCISSAFILGWVTSAETPFRELVPGVFLIIGGGLLIILRERQIK